MSRILDIIFGAAADDAARRRVQLLNVARLAERAGRDFSAAGDVSSAEANYALARSAMEAARCAR